MPATELCQIVCVFPQYNNVTISTFVYFLYIPLPIQTISICNQNIFQIDKLRQNFSENIRPQQKRFDVKTYTAHPRPDLLKASTYEVFVCVTY